jgi:glycerol-1-phosphate dehydrogenase [NAD(P)+]
MRSRVYDAFGHLGASGATAGECWRDYETKLGRWHAAAPALRTLEARWADAERELDAILAPAARLVTALRESGAPTRMSELGVEPERLRWALANCHLMRDRFTVADLAFFMGIYEAAHVDRLLAEAASIGAGA